MDNIIEPNDTFDFSKLTLAHPVGIQGGAYFTKIEYNNKPLYIQTNKSQSRQGFVKTGKKYYCDLMFDKNSETLITWFENLEERCQNLLYEKRYDWFQNNLEKNDIETAFNSSIRIYKSGKYYLIRTNIKNTRNDEPAVKIYNEDEVVLKMPDVTGETNIISILEIQGIKFTSRNFQIEIELKQVMVLNNEPIFNNCLIKTAKPKVFNESKDESNYHNNSVERSNHLGLTAKVISLEDTHLETVSEKVTENVKLDYIDIETDKKQLLDNNDLGLDNNDLGLDNNELDLVNNELDLVNNDLGLDNNDLDLVNNDLDKDLDLDFEDLDEMVNDDPNELKEVTISANLENTLESIQLKKPNQVYFELYVEARKRAKDAKKNAIIAYLEVKNIKKTYMIDNTIDSDSDFDAEIDDVSESELENL
jgi:hypothetical protein